VIIKTNAGDVKEKKWAAFFTIGVHLNAFAGHVRQTGIRHEKREEAS
jgi:hypothetical protein